MEDTWLAAVSQKVNHSLTIEKTVGYGSTWSNRQAITGAVGFTFFAGVL